MVPGLMDFGGLPGVAGLIAPRHLLAVNGRKDTLFSEESVEQAVATVHQAYRAAGCPTHFEHRWGAEGHRFYKDLMWPFVLESVKATVSKADVRFIENTLDLISVERFPGKITQRRSK